ncbi:MAG: hypothetical protein QGI74_07650 [Phycisphaerales bacterium]|nr:hypothetical protein [Phycisphaerales bacterium]
MKSVLNITAAGAVVALASSAALAVDQDQAMQAMNGFVGHWEATGTTPEGMQLIKSGTNYTLDENYQWTDDRSALLVNWTMQSKGDIEIPLSWGSGMMRWSEADKTLIYEWSGQENGTSVHGSATCASMTTNSLRWETEATDRLGRTTWFTVTTTFPNLHDNSSWTNEFQFTDKDWKPTGKPSTIEMHRYNAFAANAGKMSEMVGTWSRTLPGSNKETWTCKWGPGQRSLVGNRYATRNGSTSLVGMETIAWDEESNQFRGRYWDDQGVMINWAANNITSNGKSISWVSDWWGWSPDGTPMNGTRTSSIENGKTLSYTFGDSWYGGQSVPAATMNAMFVSDAPFTRVSTTVANVPTD